jgi:hypothetical protein
MDHLFQTINILDLEAILVCLDTLNTYVPTPTFGPFNKQKNSDIG